jgi:hypothetical protein
MAVMGVSTTCGSRSKGFVGVEASMVMVDDVLARKR